MSEIPQAVGIGLLAATITSVGAPLAKLTPLPNRVVSGALQFAAGILAGLVLFELLPPAIESLAPGVLAWCELRRVRLRLGQVRGSAPAGQRERRHRELVCGDPR